MQVYTYTGYVETWKYGNPDHPEIGKSEINQKLKPSIAAFV